MRIFGRNGFYLKKTEILEELSKVDTLVFDKTGTITQNDAYKIEMDNIRLDKDETRLLKSIVRHSSHPLSLAIYLDLPGDLVHEVTDFSEVPALGLEGTVNGRVLKSGQKVMYLVKKVIFKTDTSRVFISIDEIPKGFISIRNQYRPGMQEAILNLKGKYELHLLSGDNDAEKPNLLPLFGDKGKLHFRKSPQDKLHYNREFKKFGKTILMVGDGLNDAGALKVSHVGITIADNVYHFSPACRWYFGF